MADFLLDLSNTARSYLDTLDKKPFRQVTSKMLDLMKNPYPNDSILLKGQNRKQHRVDIGEHCIVYSVSNNPVMIENIDKRNDGAAYRFKYNCFDKFLSHTTWLFFNTHSSDANLPEDGWPRIVRSHLPAISQAWQTKNRAETSAFPNRIPDYGPYFAANSEAYSCAASFSGNSRQSGSRRSSQTPCWT